MEMQEKILECQQEEANQLKESVILRATGILGQTREDIQKFQNVPGQLEAIEYLAVFVEGGLFDGELLHLKSEKHNCGAHAVSVIEGRYYLAPMNGCWQQGHQREAEGDERLGYVLEQAEIV